MLVLSRKQQDKIRIGDDITITVLKMKGKTVRLGIEAPNEVPVLRGELVFQIEQTENKPESESVGQSSLEGVHNTSTSDVRHSRISREARAQLVPQLAQDVGPLRAMLDSRSVAL